MKLRYSYLFQNFRRFSSLEEKKAADFAGSWTTDQINVNLHRFPSQHENPPLLYPEDSEEFMPKWDSTTYPLQAKTFVYIIDDHTPYFGFVGDIFNPLLPYSPESSKITLLKLPTYSQERRYRQIQMRRSRATKVAYLFQVDYYEGTIWCYRARLPTPDEEYEAFNILRRASMIKLEVDSSSDPDFDFDILCFRYKKNELLFVQADLGSREIRKRSIALPPEFDTIDKIISTHIITFKDKDANYYAFDVSSEEIFQTAPVSTPLFLQSGSSFSQTIKGSPQARLQFFLKSNNKFYHTQIKDKPKCGSELNELMFIQGERAYYIFLLSQEGPECIYEAPYSWRKHTFFLTTRYLFEYRNHHLVRCVPFNFFLQNSSQEDDKLHPSQAFDSLDDWAVIGSMKDTELAYSKSKGFFLITHYEPPESCLCFQNEALTQISPPLLIQVSREKEAVFLLWDGATLHEIGSLELEMKNLLWITDEEVEAKEDGDYELSATPIGPNYWGVVMNDDFCSEASYLNLPLFFERKKAYLDQFFRGVTEARLSYHLEIGGQKHSLEWASEDAEECIVKGKEIIPFETIWIGLGSIRDLNEFQGTKIVKLKEGTFRVELFKFRQPLLNDYSFSFQSIQYKLHSGAERALLLVPIMTLTSNLDEQTDQLINSWLTLISSGLEFSLQVALQQTSLNQEGYELLQIPRKKEYFQELIGNTIGQLYLKVQSCNELPLLFFTLMQFTSLQEMDAVLAEGRFMSSLAKRLTSAQDKRVLSIFQKEINLLHAQAANTGMSLSSFYEAALQQIEEIYTEAPEYEIAEELEEDDSEKFKEVLRKESHKQKRQILIFRSGFKLPPSNHPMTLTLTQHLSNSEDLSIFETKLIQIYIQKRWEDSLWFFVLDYIFLLTGLLALFFQAGFFRTPYAIIPLLVSQCWNLVIESIQLKNKKCLYFRDFWNYFDIFRFIFAFTYFGVEMGGVSYSETSKTALLTLLSLFQSIKAFQIFSLFKSTRVLLRIVIEIIKDMIPFMLFVVATTTAVSLLFTSATPDAALTTATYYTFLMHVYRLDFGDFSTDDYTSLDISIFILAILIVPLILLNMLIAIMGDTFDRVREEQGRRDFQEMAGLIHRYEIVAHTFCHCNARVQKKPGKYIFVSEDVKQSGEEGGIDEWQGRIRGIKLEIDKVLKKKEKKRRANQEWKKKQEEQYKADQKKNQEWKLKNVEWQEKNQNWKMQQERKWAKSEELLCTILEQMEEITGGKVTPLLKPAKTIRLSLS